MTFDALYVNPAGRVSRGQFVPALLVLLAAIALFALLVKGRTAMFCMVVLIYPGFVLHAQRLNDMGRSAWLLLVPVLLLVLAFGIWLGYADFGPELNANLPRAALLVTAATAAWGAVARSRKPIAR